MDVKGPYIAEIDERVGEEEGKGKKQAEAAEDRHGGSKSVCSGIF